MFAGRKLIFSLHFVTYGLAAIFQPAHFACQKHGTVCYSARRLLTSFGLHGAQEFKISPPDGQWHRRPAEQRPGLRGLAGVFTWKPIRPRFS
jgi:hypothetical protein